MYNRLTRDFLAPNGEVRTFTFREDTNDENVIRAAFCEDEYRIMGLEFKEGDVVLDLGAHIGAVTLLMTTIRPDLRIFAFEPMPDNFELLKKNVTESDYQGEINIYRQAVWFYEEDTVKIFYGDSSENGKTHRNIGSLFKIHDFYNDRLFKKAKATNLSKIFEENHITSCRFVKMDVEGSEYGILKACPKEVLSMIDRIHGEYHWVGDKPLKNPRSNLLLLAKDVFKDITEGEEEKPVGPFVFVRK